MLFRSLLVGDLGVVFVLIGGRRGRRGRDVLRRRRRCRSVAPLAGRIGGVGGSNVKNSADENIVALCDLDLARCAGTIKQFPKAALFTDFRKMLETQKDIDAVMVATPDHNHAVVTMMALKMGKHVFCQSCARTSLNFRWECPMCRYVPAKTFNFVVSEQLKEQIKGKTMPSLWEERENQVA